MAEKPTFGFVPREVSINGQVRVHVERGSLQKERKVMVSPFPKKKKSHRQQCPVCDVSKQRTRRRLVHNSCDNASGRTKAQRPADAFIAVAVSIVIFRFSGNYVLRRVLVDLIVGIR